MRRIMLLAFVIHALAWLTGSEGASQAQTCAYGEPASNLCHQPRVISGDVGQHVVLMDATTATNTGSIGGVPAGNLVYFDFVPQVSGPIRISTCHPNTLYDTVVGLYRRIELCEFEYLTHNDDALGANCEVHCTGTPGELTAEVTAGTTYTIIVGSYNFNPLNCPLCLGLILTIGQPCGDAPRNFVCETSHLLSGLLSFQEVLLDTRDAIGNEHWSCQPNVRPIVWFSITPVYESTLLVDTCLPGTNYDTVIQILRAPHGCTGPMESVTCQDDPGCPTALATAAWAEAHLLSEETYFIEVGGYFNSTGCLRTRFTLTSLQAACCLATGSCVQAGPVECAQLLGGVFQGTGSTCATTVCEPSFPLGDMNCDGVVSVGDIAGFVLALTNPAAYQAQYPNCEINNADMNQNGVVSVTDIGLFVQTVTGGG